MPNKSDAGNSLSSGGRVSGASFMLFLLLQFLVSFRLSPDPKRSGNNQSPP